MRDQIETVHLMRDIVERLDKVARQTDDTVLAAKLARMARELETHAAMYDPGAQPSSPAGSGAGRRFPR